jgi:hypothetical protein
MKVPIRDGVEILRREGTQSFISNLKKYTTNTIKPNFSGYAIGYPLMKYRLRSLPRQVDKVRKIEDSDEWLLVVLDACRYDRFEMVFDTYFEGTVEPVASEGYNTFEYVRRVWPDQHDITYVTGAAPINATEFNFDGGMQLQGIGRTDKRLAERYNGYRPVDHIDEIVEIWRTDWSEELGVCPPEPVTDASIEHAGAASQLVAHYFQPHVPYIGKERALGNIENIERRLQGGAIGSDIWNRARSGDITRRRLLELYDSNLRRALNSVCRLVQETDFENIAIMGDHGEALGEYSIYAHPELPHPYTRIVPWATVESVLKEPDFNYGQVMKQRADQPQKDATLNDRLESLGYI